VSEPNFLGAAIVLAVLAGVAIHGTYWTLKYGVERKSPLENNGADAGGYGSSDCGDGGGGD
jgi:hypothetical protein